jgi:hypothetical protein
VNRKILVPEPRSEAWDRLSLTALRRNLPWSHLHFGLVPPELGRYTCLVFEPLGLWCFVTSAPAN